MKPTIKQNSPYAYSGLSRVFHERARLGIMTCLVQNRAGLSFKELKEACDLSDGNLNRHLKVLEEETFVKIDKARSRQTVISCTKTGIDSFMTYLDELEKVVKDAVRASKKLVVKND